MRVRGYITCKQFRLFYLGGLIFWHFCCSPFNKTIRKLSLNWGQETAIFRKNPSGNCRLPPEVVLFSRSERRKFSHHLLNSPVSSLLSTENNMDISRYCFHGYLRDWSLKYPWNYKWYAPSCLLVLCWFWKNPYHFSAVIPAGLFRKMLCTLYFTWDKFQTKIYPGPRGFPWFFSVRESNESRSREAVNTNGENKKTEKALGPG